MRLEYQKYRMEFRDGGLEIRKNGQVLYCNLMPLFVTVKTNTAINVDYSGAYHAVRRTEDKILAEGILELPSGSSFRFEDFYGVDNSGFWMKRKVQVLKKGSDLGFSTRFSLKLMESEDPEQYDCFAPGAWYRQNQFAPEELIGKDLSQEYFWQLETKFALPVFAMQNQKSGETIAVARRHADIKMRTLEVEQSENYVDENFTIGSIGMSRPSEQTLNYMYYGFAVRTPNAVCPKGLFTDYVYPGAEGQIPGKSHYAGLDFQNQPMDFKRMNHPVREGFEQAYSIVITPACRKNYGEMMKYIWRLTCVRMSDQLFSVDNEKHYHNCMQIFLRYTGKYGKAYGLPFACQLPNMDISSVSFQFGFVGQQPGIGYLLLRYGKEEHLREAEEKRLGILEFWTHTEQTECGLPGMCYNPNINGFEPYPYYLRMIADGMEAIADAYVYMRNIGEEKHDWLSFCRRTADWLVRAQNEDGSYYRAYYGDGSVRMKSGSNTPSVIRFLVQMYLITGEEKYRRAAEKAGEWSARELCPTMEYRGGTCDNADVQDKEAGIYALFGFLALYDLTGKKKWLEAAQEAADYTETWTYMWKFPVAVPWKKHPFARYTISGQSIITIGGGADVYMAACAYVYYRLYLLTDDPHYLEFSRFIYRNTRQANDIDGSCGYCMPGLGHESGGIYTQKMRSQYHWLPWCTFVEAEPSMRFHSTFGYYEIEEIEKMPEEERKRKNQIYRSFPKADLIQQREI